MVGKKTNLHISYSVCICLYKCSGKFSQSGWHDFLSHAIQAHNSTKFHAMFSEIKATFVMQPVWNRLEQTFSLVTSIYELYLCCTWLPVIFPQYSSFSFFTPPKCQPSRGQKRVKSNTCFWNISFQATLSKY